MSKELVKKYLDAFYPNTTEDIIDNQEKKTRNLIRKLENKQSVFEDLPFQQLDEDEQVKLLHFILRDNRKTGDF